MKVSPDLIEQLASGLLGRYQTEGLAVFQQEQSRILSKIKDIVAQNFKEEEEIEKEARQMLASHVGQSENVDRHKMFLLIKKKVAEQRGFAL